MVSRLIRASGAIAAAAGTIVFIGLTSHSAAARAEEGNQSLRQIFGLITGDTRPEGHRRYRLPRAPAAGPPAKIRSAAAASRGR